MTRKRMGEFEELILLAVGRLDDDAHSVAIQEILLADAGRDATSGAIYAALDRLERKESVTSRLAEPTATPGGRRKRHYTLTEQGCATLADLRRVRNLMWQRMREAQDAQGDSGR